MDSLRWRGVVRQAHDFSCGTGSIANLIRLTGATPPDEQTLIDRYAKIYGEKALREAMRSGFSLLDLKLIMSSLGYHTVGLRYEAGTMPEDPQPMIVYLVVKGYRHFSVFDGMDGGLVVLIDPSRGRIRITQERFFFEWDGSALCFAEKNHFKTLPNIGDGLTEAQEAARNMAIRLR